MIKVTGKVDVLMTLKDDLQEVLRKQKIEQNMIFKRDTEHYYIRL